MEIGKLMKFEELVLNIDNGVYDNDVFKWMTDLEITLGNPFMNWPNNIKQKIHAVAYDRGHANGFREVYYQYDDLIDIANLAIKSVQ